MKQNIYQPYFRAVKQVLDGQPVESLDDIREQCNEEFLKKTPQDKKEGTKPYSPGLLVISFVADAENNILMGTEPAEAYAEIGRVHEEFRDRGRKVIETIVKKYLG